MLLIFLFSIFLVARDYIVFPNVKCTAKFADDASIFNNIHCIICKSVSIICEGMVSWWQSCNNQAKSLAAFLYILSSSAFEANLVVEHWVWDNQLTPHPKFMASCLYSFCSKLKSKKSWTHIKKKLRDIIARYVAQNIKKYPAFSDVIVLTRK